jgi:hypothetical protein
MLGERDCVAVTLLDGLRVPGWGVGVRAALGERVVMPERDSDAVTLAEGLREPGRLVVVAAQ